MRRGLSADLSTLCSSDSEKCGESATRAEAEADPMCLEFSILITSAATKMAGDDEEEQVATARGARMPRDSRGRHTFSPRA
jgi:hypothetical protein